MTVRSACTGEPGLSLRRRGRTGPHPSTSRSHLLDPAPDCPDLGAGSVAPIRQVDPTQSRTVRATRDSAALGDRPAVDLLEVPGEIDRRRAADVRPDGKGGAL